ncbi:MAG: DUF5683 domain-containing protein [Candidatus Dadabacteria bacterium]|nr:DUF5683 domain-containing protein [Candidatus Dadabacteria bacterium]MCY4262876.1 DUF5683 domain-containing protein [Candidatus Dadabacteria bacterium]
MRGKRRKKPWLAVLLSLVFPGLGQLYNRQLKKAVPIFALIIIVNILSSEPLEVFFQFADASALENIPLSTLTLVAGYSLATLLIMVISIYDANATARKINLDIEEKQP